MKLGNLKDTFAKVGDTVKENDSAIMAALSIGGMIAAVIFSLRNAKKMQEIVQDETMDNAEKVKKLAPVAAPVIVSATISTVSTIGLYKKNQKLGKLLGAAVSTASTMKTIMDETEKATKAVVGEEKAEEIQKEVQKNVTKTIEKGTSVGQEVYDTGTGKHIYQFKKGGVTIRASKDYVYSCLKSAQLWVQKQYRGDDPEDNAYITVYDIATLLAPNKATNLSDTTKLIGWKVSNLPNGELHFSTKDTFNFENEDGDDEPGYLIDILDNTSLVPDWADTYRR